MGPVLTRQTTGPTTASSSSREVICCILNIINGDEVEAVSSPTKE